MPRLLTEAASQGFDVQIGACQSDIPDAHLKALRRRLGEQPRHGASAERGLEREVLALPDRAFEQAALGGAVAITKHNTPKAVLLSYAEFEALTKASTPALDDLSDQFDQLLERMQTPQAKSAMVSAFDATPEQLGRAAVKAARPKR